MTVSVPTVDVLGDALRALRIEGTVLLREVYTPPFEVVVPPATDLGSRLQLPPDARVVAFHLAEHGSFELRLGASDAEAVRTGESAFCFGGQSHRLTLGEKAGVVHFASLLDSDAVRVFRAMPAAGAEQTRIICGALVLRDTLLNPLFTALPDVLHVRHGGAGEPCRVRQVTALLCAEFERDDPGAGYVVERLLEVLGAEAIRRFATERRDAIGWFRGLADVRVHRALSAFHAEPGGDWSIARLARAAHLSPSRFAARFRAATGESVMAYVTRWRMNLAMKALRGTTDSVAAIAGRAGYESLPAFSRAFKRHVGQPPAMYRARQSPVYLRCEET